MHRWRTQQTAIRSVNCRIQWIIESLNANGAPGQAGSTSVWASFSLKCKPCVCTGLRSCRVPIQVTGIPWSRALSVADSQVQESCLRFDFCAGLLLRAHFCRVGPQIRRDYLLNLSISISRGKETNKDSPSNGERSGKSSSLKSLAVDASEFWPGEAAGPWLVLSKLTWKGTSERVTAPCATPPGRATTVFRESGCLGMQPKVGGKLHLKLNMGTRPIANKYREGKVKSTLKRESKRPRNH